MTSAIRRSPDDGGSDVEASPASRDTPQDYYAVLLHAIADASSDPARLRKLVYAMAQHNLNPDAVLAQPVVDTTKQARTLLELDQALQLERAIKRLESQSAPAPSLADSIPPAPEPERPMPGEKAPIVARAWPETAIPRPAEEAADAPIRHLHRIGSRAKSLLQLGAATAIGLALFVGIFAAIHALRPATSIRAARVSLPPATALLPTPAETVGSARAGGNEPAAISHVDAPLPALANYGVYGSHNGQLIELELLPVAVPAAGVRLSAEITRPSRAILPGDQLKFVVFRKNLSDEIPATLSVRVVGRVARRIAFVDLRARVTPLESSWRIRDTAYELKVAPAEDHRELFIVQPDVALPPGRYALVLNGSGYDFTVAGAVTAAEQCLEQTQVVNRVVITECPRS